LNLDPEFNAKRNKGARRRLSAWVSQFSEYQQFSEGCSLILDFYDTDDILKRDYWTLHEMMMRFNSCISISLYYGNAYQIQHFVPWASKIVTDIVTEMLKRKRKSIDKVKVDRPANWRLDAKQVKADINSLKVFEHYFPEMKKRGSGKTYKAFCKWHADTKNPNLSIDPDGHCHCYACGAHYDTFGVVMALENVDFATAVARVWELGK
jgi:hypothetical protein